MNDSETRWALAIPQKGDQVVRVAERHRFSALIGKMVRAETVPDRLRPTHLRPEEAGVTGSPVVLMTGIFTPSLTDVLDSLQEPAPDEDKEDVL